MEYNYNEEPDYDEELDLPVDVYSADESMDRDDGDSDEYESGDDIVEWVDESHIAPADKLAVNSFHQDDELPGRMPFAANNGAAPTPFPQHLVQTPHGPVAAPPVAAHHPVVFPPVNYEPLPANHHLGLVRSLKHATLKTLKARTRYRRGTDVPGQRPVPNRPWLFNYRFPNHAEWGVYYLACPIHGCESLYKHPLIDRRGENHLLKHSLPCIDVKDMMHKYAVQVVREPGALQVMTYDMCRDYNRGIIQDVNGDAAMAWENFTRPGVPHPAPRPPVLASAPAPVPAAAPNLGPNPVPHVAQMSSAPVAGQAPDSAQDSLPAHTWTQGPSQAPDDPFFNSAQ